MIARLSQSECKQLASLKIKKYRTQHQLFMVEGEKLLEEALISDIPVKAIVALEEWWQKHPLKIDGVSCLTASPQQLKYLSQMVTPPPVITVVHIPHRPFGIKDLQHKITIALENIQDPGNLGTIIRLADWFGIEHVVCSSDSVEAYNPKVIQSSMGSIFRVKVHYADLKLFIKEAISLHIPVLGTFLDGKNVYNEQLPNIGILVMGNESRGISAELAALIDRKITIVSTNASQRRAESLNVAVAAAIVCAEWHRRIYWQGRQLSNTEI
ncbi:MAG: RNA methyltransferase [Bacteroidales bacterium]